jgi:hypothetical protein
MHDLRSLWQQQPPDERRAISLDDVRQRARALELKVRRMDVIMYASGVINVGAFAAVLWYLPHLRIVAALVIVTALVILFQYHRRRPVRGADDVVPSDACLDYYRVTLQRKRDLSQKIGRWFLPPAIAGQAALMAGFLIAPPGVPRRLVWMVLPFWLLIDVVIFVGAWRRHRRAAASAARELEELERWA